MGATSDNSNLIIQEISLTLLCFALCVIQIGDAMAGSSMFRCLQQGSLNAIVRNTCTNSATQIF